MNEEIWVYIGDDQGLGYLGIIKPSAIDPHPLA